VDIEKLFLKFSLEEAISIITKRPCMQRKKGGSMSMIKKSVGV
jgi:hypothetical protein